MRFSSFLTAGILCWLAAVPALALSAAEKQATAYIEQYIMEDGISTLEEAVNINSGTFNPEGVKKAAAFFDRHFSALGFETWTIPLDTIGRGMHLFAEHKGNPENNTLLLIGHIDTVFEKNSPFQRFTKVSDTLATGPGVTDMKGGIVVMLEALKALKHAGLLEEMNILVALIGDEENVGLDKDNSATTSRGPLIDLARRSDYALGFEPAQGTDVNKVAIARRGFNGWTMEITAGGGHSSRVWSKELGAGAVYAAADILHAIQQKLHGHENLTLNPGIFAGGQSATYDDSTISWNLTGKQNIIATKAVISGDIRFLTPEQLDMARSTLQQIVSSVEASYQQRYDAPISIRLTFDKMYPSMPPTEGNLQLLSLLSGISQELGYGTVETHDPSSRGAADISFVASYVKGAIDGLGPTGDYIHSVDENILLHHLPQITKRAVLLLHRLSSQKH